jgi:hypothetical protein
LLNHPDKRLLQALANLESDTDFKVVKDWLYASLNQMYIDGSYAKEDHQARWFQGAEQVLSELLDKAEHAREALRKN